MPVDRFIIFARRPAAGRVKTRLSPELPPDAAAAVYEACLRDVITAAARQRGRVELWYDAEPGGREYFESEFRHIHRQPQADGDLGERLGAAFAQCFGDGAARVLIAGSDAPTVPDAMYAAAFDHLHEADAVIGPTVDGGYYLMGLAAGAWPGARLLFHEVPWSTADVYATTIERASRAALDLRILPGWYDIDRVEDLNRARADMAPESHLARWLADAHAAGLLG
jgi:uncharacterized protein